jgi:hypothetical protein
MSCEGFFLGESCEGIGSTQRGGGAPAASVPLGKGKGRVTVLEQEFFLNLYLSFPVIHLLSEPYH